MAIQTQPAFSGFIASDPQLSTTESGDARLYMKVGKEHYRQEEDGSFTQLETTFHHLVAFKALELLRVRLYQALVPQTPALMQRSTSGDLLVRATKDIDRIEVFFAHTFPPAVTAVTVPVMVSKVPSRVTSALCPTEKEAASAAGNSSCRVILELSRMTATSWPLVTSSPFATLRVLTTPATSARTYWRSTVLS